MRAGRLVMVGAWLAACADDPDAPDLLDTGWFPAEPVDTDGGGLCAAALASTATRPGTGGGPCGSRSTIPI